MRFFFGVCLMSMALLARAEMYRCEQDGRIVFTDHPCAAGAQPHEPSRATVVSPGKGSDLAREYDERLSRQTENRDEADAEWLERHESEKADAARIRKALVENKVVGGMTPAQVRRVLGDPDDVARNVSGGKETERWTYRDGKARRTVNFKDGRVSQSSEKSSKKPSKKK